MKSLKSVTTMLLLILSAVAFAQKIAMEGIPEGSVLEIRVDRPDGESMSANLRVLPQDIEMLETLKSMRQ